MLENWDKVQKYAKTGANSAGTAMEKYGIILESVEAKQAQLTAKVQEFYSSVLNGGLIAGLLDVGKAFMDIVNIGDGFVGKILLLTTATVAWIAVLESLKKSGITSFTSLIAKILGVDIAQKTATGSAIGLKAVWDALSAHPIVLTLTAITALLTAGISLWNYHNQRIQESIDKANELTDAYKSSNQEIQDNLNSLTEGSGSYGSLQSEFDELCKGVDKYGNNISLTTSQYERYKSICEQIVGLNPDLMDGYNSATEAIGNQSSALQTLIEDLKEKQRLESQQFADKSDELTEGRVDERNKSVKSAVEDNITWQNRGKLREILQGVTGGDSNTLVGELQENADELLKDVDGYWEKLGDKIVERYKVYNGEVYEDLKNIKEKNDISWSELLNNTNKYINDNNWNPNNNGYLNTFKNYKKEYYAMISELKGIPEVDITDIIEAKVKGSENYSELNNGSKNFLTKYIESNFKLPDNIDMSDDDAVKKFTDEAKSTASKLQNALAKNKDNAKLQNAFDEFYKIDADKIDFNDYEKQSQKIAQKISDILQQDLTGDGLVNGDDVAKIKIALDADIDASAIEERTNKINELITNSLGNIEDPKIKNDFSDYFKGLSTTELDRAKVALQLFGNEIKNVSDLKDKMNIFEGMDNALNSVAEGFSNAQTKAQAYQDTMKELSGENSTEYDTAFNAHTDAVKALEKEFKKGTVGSKKFAESAKYLFGESFDVTNVDEVYKRLSKLQKLFKEGTYGEGLLKRLKELGKVGDSWAKKNKDGTWDFNIDTSEKGIKQLAKQLGIAEDGVWSCLLALQMLGKIDIFDTEGIENYATQLGLVDEITTKINGKEKQLKSLNVAQLRDTLDQAGVNVENLDEALKGLEEKGYLLVDVAGDAQTLANQMSQIGLVASNGAVELGVLVDTLSGMGYTSGQIQTVIDKLKTVDSVTIDGKEVKLQVQGDEEANKKLNKIKSQENEVSENKATATIAVKGAKEANSKILTVSSNLSSLNGKKAVTTIITRKITEHSSTGDGGSDLKGVGNNFSGKSHLKGTAFTQGNWGAKRTETALVGEVEPEIWVHADTGKWELVTHPQFLRIKKGDVIFNGQQTRDLLGKGSSLSFGTSFLGGTAYYGATGFGGADWNKRRYPNSGSGSRGGSGSGSRGGSRGGSGSGSRGGSRGGSTKKKNTGSGGTDKKWWETQLENLKDNLDYNAITMDTYINGIENILKKLKMASKDWKEVNKELQSAKLERVENQFDRGEITIDKYISKLTELRKSYKKNSEGYKELTQKINEAKADKFADQYERGEISLKSYITQLTKLRNSYKKNSEEWKKYNDLIKETKLNDLNDRYERGKITTDKYIKGLLKLADTYKDGSKEAKEFEKTVMDAYADNMADKYERGEISLKKYIDELIYMRSHYKKNTEEWEKYNDLIKETKLDDINDRYERSKITTDEYIKELLKLAKTYKDGSKEAKEFENTIMDAYADNMADKYERGEISLKKYIDELIYMRSHYKKNTEEWKKYNDLINSTKADYYADQYERGKISADTYIQKLEELRKACKKGSEEYKEYTDEINNAKLDKAEKYVEGLTKKVEKFDDAIERLGNVNTDKEKKSYAKLLSGKYEQVQSNKVDTKVLLDADKKYDDSIKKRNQLLKEQEKYKKGSKQYNNLQKEINSLDKYIKKHEKDNLTADERNTYQEYYNQLLKDEVSIRDEIEDSVREYYENQKQQAEQQAELAKKKKLYEKEVELYGKGGKELWEYNNNKKIDEIQKVIDQRNAEKEALDDINEREELSNNLLEAKLKLQNALNNKTTKILTKQEDGTWAYTFSANMSDVKSAKEEVDSAQKALDDYDWEQGTKELQDKIDKLNDNAEKLSKQYEDTEFWADREYEQTMNNIEKVYGDIDGLVEQWMNTYGTTTDNLISSYQSLTNASIKLENSLVNLEKYNNAYYETVGSTNTITAKDGVKSFDTGGEVVGSGLAFVHDKERVLTKEQNANYMKLLNEISYAKKFSKVNDAKTLEKYVNELAKLRDSYKKNSEGWKEYNDLIKMIKVDTLNTQLKNGKIAIDVSKIDIQNYQKLRSSIVDGKNNQTIIQSVTCTFPNITTTDGLQKAILDLPRIALQRKK